MRKVIETKVVPTYCKPGFAIAGSGINLDHEELRICYVTTQNARIARKTPEEKRREADIDAAQKRRIEDARAMVREDWQTYGRQIEVVEIAYACDLIASWEVGVAVSKIQNLMFNVQVQAGLIDDPAMNIKDFTKPWIDIGRNVAHDGACDQMPPASRARLRAMVSALMY